MVLHRDNLNTTQKFSLISWKNWRIERQHKLQLFFVVLGPAVFTILILTLRFFVDTEYLPESHYTQLNLTENINLNGIRELLYSPSNTFLEEIVQKTATRLNIMHIKGLDNRTILELELLDDNFFAGIEFEDSWESIEHYPLELKYALRFPGELRTWTEDDIQTWQTNKLLPNQNRVGPRNLHDNDGGLPVGYYREGFLHLQHAIFLSYMELVAPNSSIPEICMQRYPYPESKVDDFILKVARYIPVLFMMSYLLSAIIIVKTVTDEKEKRVYHLMKVMGIGAIVQWLSWFIKYLILLGITIVIMIILFTIKWIDDVAVFTHSSGSVILIFLLVYCAALITFSLMLSSCFAKMQTAVVYCGVFALLFFLPYLLTDCDEQSLASKIFSCFLYNSALGYGFQVICSKEISGEGVQWKNLFSTSSMDDTLALGHIILLMLISCIIYITIGYISGKVLKPHNYEISTERGLSFCNCSCIKRKRTPAKTKNTDVENPRLSVQREMPYDVKVGVKIRDLKKVFGDKTAVQDLSIDLHQNEITTLLGVSGSGKTTTILMLVGLLSKTSGNIGVPNRDSRISTRLRKAHNSVGYCAQKDILFDDISVHDHIAFYCILRGLRGVDITNTVSFFIEFMNLTQVENVPAKKLSINLKRKLSICCALCGDSQIVYLDEPSVGMTTLSKHKFWRLLQSENEGRTILTTTNSGVEAELLANRIAVITDGRLQMYGSSRFLKKNMNTGFRLICIKSNVKEGINNKPFDITLWLKNRSAEIELEKENDNELIYVLPLTSQYKLGELFKALESNLERLNITHYSIQSRTIDNIINKETNKTAEMENVRIDKDISFKKSQEAPLGKLIRYRFLALFYKKYLCTLRRKVPFIMIFLALLFLVLSSIIIFRTNERTYVLPPHTVDFKHYTSAITVLEYSNSTWSTIKTAEEYRRIVRSYAPNNIFRTTRWTDFSEYIIELGHRNQREVDKRYLVASTIKKNHITAWFNNEYLHTAPLSLNLVHNALAKTIYGVNTSITVINKPRAFLPDTIFQLSQTGIQNGTKLGIYLGIGLIIFLAYFAMLIIQERVTNFKELQFIGRVGPWTYWLTNFLCDFCIIIIAAIIMVLPLFLLQITTFSNVSQISAFFLLLIIFGFAMLPLTYLLSYFFDEPATGFGGIILIHLILGVFVHMLFESISSWYSAGFYFTWPLCALFEGVKRLYNSYFTQEVCVSKYIYQPSCEMSTYCYEQNSVMTSVRTGILWTLIALLLFGLLFFLILLLIEFGYLKKTYNKVQSKIVKRPPPSRESEIGDECKNERNKILGMNKADIAKTHVVLKGVTKYYENDLVVNQAYMNVERGERFCIIGDSDAGKTTIIKMITGATPITYGKCYVNGLCVTDYRMSIQKMIGYCPQNHALLDELTGRETLKIFCLLHGLEMKETKKVCNDMSEIFDFQERFDEPIKTYSAAEKRKLNVAIAMIDGPKLIYLDDPAAELNEEERQQIYNVLKALGESGTTLIIATQSINECELLSTRIAIMFNGEIKFIGTMEELKKKFLNGFILYIKVESDLFLPTLSSSSSESPENITQKKRNSELIDLKKKETIALENDIKTFLDEQFPNAVLREEYNDSLLYYVPLEDLTWSEVFERLEKNRALLGIEEYTITPLSYEDIRQNFVVNNEEEIEQTDP